MRKKLLSIGDKVIFTAFSGQSRYTTGVYHGQGRIVAFIPFTDQVDVMDSRGHVWRTYGP